MNQTSRLVKFSLIALFVIAGLAITRVVVLVDKSLAPARATISSARINYQDSNDFDQDGLSNSDEAFWGSDPFNPDSDGDGFLDGEEVASGFSPVDANNDSLAARQDILNLGSSERLALILVGGIVDGGLNKKTASPQTFASSVDSVANATIYSALNALENIQPTAVKNITDNSHSSQESYLNEFSGIISRRITSIIFSQPRDLLLLFSPDQSNNDGQLYTPEQQERIKDRFLQYANDFRVAADSLDGLPVPESWVDIHQRAVLLLRKVELYHRSIALGSSDPLRQLIVLGNLQNVYLESQPLLLGIVGRAKKNNLRLPDDDFFNISLILNSGL